mmetsp:Transcript_16880/g.23466  ORF Transcript_16880/g.23466 Transcript_16880/m.23466 type:complete len:201 (+) Transcript_16880:100-702(+)
MMRFASNPMLILMLLLATTSRSSARSSILDDNDFMASSSTSSSSLYESKCQEWGFDVYQLSCETCDIMPPKHQSNCQACCQSWKTLETRTERYGYAIMVEGSYMSENLQEFVNEDIEKVKEATSFRFSLIPSSDKSMGGGFGRMGGMMMGGSSPQLYFFESQPSNVQDESTFATQAKKTIDLQAWKRDDVRDMLMALLTK